MSRTILHRMWINQPSTLQPDHKRHGANVLVEDYDPKDGEKYVDVWFTSGPVSSMRIARLSLSEGWRN